MRKNFKIILFCLMFAVTIFAGIIPAKVNAEHTHSFSGAGALAARIGLKRRTPIIIRLSKAPMRAAQAKSLKKRNLLPAESSSAIGAKPGIKSFGLSISVRQRPQR